LTIKNQINLTNIQFLVNTQEHKCVLTT
jgi:hypothetical protein